jgi:hypothetical protein
MGAVRPGKMTVPLRGRTGRVWRVAMGISEKENVQQLVIDG